MIALGLTYIALGTVALIAFARQSRRADDFADALTERDLPPHHLRERAP
jgi:hypothetical protein